MSANKDIEDLLLKIFTLMQSIPKDNNVIDKQATFTLKERIQEIYQSMLSIHKRMDTELPAVIKQIHNDIDIERKNILNIILDIRNHISRLESRVNESEKKLYAIGIALSIAIFVVKRYWK